MLRALLAHPQDMSIHWTSTKCSESEVCIKLVVLLRSIYVTMTHGHQNVKSCLTMSLLILVPQIIIYIYIYIYSNWCWDINKPYLASEFNVWFMYCMVCLFDFLHNFTKDFPKSLAFFSYSPVHLRLFDDCLFNKEFIFTSLTKHDLAYSKGL
jgi:hypothetical protein